MEIQEIKKELREFFNEQDKVSDKMIESFKDFLNVCCLLKKDDKDFITGEVIGLKFRTYDEKEKIREHLKKYILSKQIIGYVLCLDTKLTIMDKTNKKEPVVKDGVMKILCSPYLRIQKCSVYDNETRQIIERQELLDTDKDDSYKVFSEWDLYGEYGNNDDNKEIDKYEKFKKDNPHLYKDICK